MATIKRTALAFPDLKQGDTYPAFDLPEETPPGAAITVGSTVLGQIRDGTNLPRLYDWGGTIVAGKVRMNAIPPTDTRRFKAGTYTAEVQVTTPAGVVTTEVHVGVLKVLADNCYAESGPALVGPNDGDTDGPPGSGGFRWKREVFAFTGAGPYETEESPNGDYAEVELDGLGQPDDPFEIVPAGFTLVGVTDVQKVVFRYSY